MLEEKKNFYLVSADVLPETLQKTAQIKLLLSKNSLLTVNEAVEQVGLSRSAFYKYRDSIFPYYKTAKERVLTLVIISEDDVQVLAECLQVITEAECKVLTINRGIPRQNIANAALVIDTKEMKQDIETLLENLYEIPKVKEIELLD